MKLRIGHLSTLYHTAMVLMADGSAGKKLGADIEWRLFGTGPDIVDSLRKRELDMAYIGIPPVIIGIDRGVAIRCIAGGHIEGSVISAKRHYKGFPETDSLSDILKQFCGLRIGVPGKGSIHDVIITEYIERFGLQGKVEILNFKWADEVTEAVVHDRIAAAVGTPALAVAVQRYANGRVLYPPSSLWPNNPSYGIVVDIDFLNRERGTVEKFIILHEEATSFLRNNPHEAARLIADYVKFIDADFVMATLKISPKYCAQLTDDYIFSTMEFASALLRLGYISRMILSEEIFDASLIRKIHSSNDHYGDGIKQTATDNTSCL